MKYKAIIYFNNKKISEGTFTAGIAQFLRRSGISYTDDGFKIKYKILNTKENNDAIDKFLDDYPTSESFYKEYMRG